MNISHSELEHFGTIRWQLWQQGSVMSSNRLFDDLPAEQVNFEDLTASAVRLPNAG
jgi:hypothetical protein